MSKKHGPGISTASPQVKCNGQISESELPAAADSHQQVDLSRTPAEVPVRRDASDKLSVVAASLVVALAVATCWWLGPHGYFYTFDARQYDGMSPAARTLAGLGVDLRVARARLTHKVSWLRNSLAAAGDYRLCQGNEMAAESAYVESLKYGYTDFHVHHTLIALYAKQERWKDAEHLLNEIYDESDWKTMSYPNSYRDQKFNAICRLVCERAGNQKGVAYFKEVQMQSKKPWVSEVLFKSSHMSELMDEGCRDLIAAKYESARQCFDLMQDADMDEPSRARGAIMEFVTSMMANDRRAADRNVRTALTAYEYMQNEPSTQMDRATFLHHYAAYLRLQGRHGEAAETLKKEELTRRPRSEAGSPFSATSTGSVEVLPDEGPG